MEKPHFLGKFSHNLPLDAGQRREKIDAVLLDRLEELDGNELEQLGPLLLTKAATMPFRLLYTLDPDCRVLSTEEALHELHRTMEAQAWWPLVVAGLKWRQVPPSTPAEWPVAAR